MSQTTVKITLGSEVVYEFEVWTMPHHAGVDLILGTDFMIPAGIQLDLFNATAKLPDEIAIPLLKSAREVDETTYGQEIVGGPTSSLDVESRLYKEFQLRRTQPSTSTHDLWIRRLPSLVPTILYSKKGRASRVRMTNISAKCATCPAHYPLLLWLPYDAFFRDDGYV